MKNQNDDLRSLLQSGDPAGDGSEPTPAQLARMRQEILDAAQAASPRRWVPIPAVAAVMVALVALVGWSWWQRDATRPALAEQTTHVESPAEEPQAEPARPARQIQFSTPGGTRVIWNLDPDFEV